MLSLALSVPTIEREGLLVRDPAIKVRGDETYTLAIPEPAAAHKLLQLLADSVIEYLNAKIRAGCDATSWYVPGIGSPVVALRL